MAKRTSSRAAKRPSLARGARSAAGYSALRSRLVARTALARALMTEQTPEQRERYDQHHGRDRAAADAGSLDHLICEGDAFWII